LSDNGILLLSGFYKEDLDAIENECLKYQIKLLRYLTKNNWIAARFSKSVNNES
jgi:ribosomal protein L11 methyltransferase